MQHVLVEGHEPVPKVLGPQPSGEQYWPAVFVQVYVDGEGEGDTVGVGLTLQQTLFDGQVPVPWLSVPQPSGEQYWLLILVQVY